MIYLSKTWPMKVEHKDDGDTHVWSHTEGQEVL
jgi:hypothetical protein